MPSFFYSMCITCASLWPKCLTETTYKEKRRSLFELTVSELLLHHDKEGVVEQDGSHHGGQKAEEVEYQKGPGQDTHLL
jgi:hypothetical protein